MRRVLDEISDDEWDHHSFKPSRILKKPKPSPPPPIESFAYRSKAAAPKPAASSSAVVNLSDDDDFDWDLNDTAPAADKDDDDWNISDEDEEIAAEDLAVAEDLEDDFDEEEQPAAMERALPPRSTRGRRIVIDEDSDLEDEGLGIEEDDDDEEEEFGIVEKRGHGRGEEPDVVGKALQKCAKISAELKKELYGSSSVSAERYAEVETSSSSARIVMQEDVDAACTSEDSDFEPTLKPYQLVGVNFLLLLYRKHIGGGNFSVFFCCIDVYSSSDLCCCYLKSCDFEGFCTSKHTNQEMGVQWTYVAFQFGDK